MSIIFDLDLETIIKIIVKFVMLFGSKFREITRFSLSADRQGYHWTRTGAVVVVHH